MSVKISISLSEADDAYVHGLVTQGRYPNVDAVIRRAVELIQEQTHFATGEDDPRRADRQRDT